MNHVANCAVAVLIVAAVAVAAEKPAPPTVTFGKSGVSIGSVQPGTRIAWLAMIREPRPYHTAVRILRGFGPANAHSTFDIAREAADEARGIWTVVDVDAGTAIHALTPAMVTSNQPIVVHAAAGEPSVSIESGAVEVLYVRPRMAAWAFSVADGGGLDGDGTQNGSITMRLASLRRFKGNPHPPETVAAGDLILIIDSRGLRTASIEVAP